jgi:solute carrier family 25 uncoupling protein 8/9
MRWHTAARGWADAAPLPDQVFSSTPAHPTPPATYDTTKRWIMAATGWADAAATHLACALITGMASTLATNPVDVVKTHMFMAGGGAGGPLAVARRIGRAHGAAGFLRGFAANYARLGPQTVVTFTVAEQLRRLAGLQAL